MPEGWSAVIEKMMAKDPAERYQTPPEVAEALAPWTQTPIPPPPESGDAAPEPGGHRGESHRDRRRPTPAPQGGPQVRIAEALAGRPGSGREAVLQSTAGRASNRAEPRTMSRTQTLQEIDAAHPSGGRQAARCGRDAERSPGGRDSGSLRRSPRKGRRGSAWARTPKSPIAQGRHGSPLAPADRCRPRGDWPRHPLSPRKERWRSGGWFSRFRLFPGFVAYLVWKFILSRPAPTIALRPSLVVTRDPTGQAKRLPHDQAGPGQREPGDRIILPTTATKKTLSWTLKLAIPA